MDFFYGILFIYNKLINTVLTNLLTYAYGVKITSQLKSDQFKKSSGK